MYSIGGFVLDDVCFVGVVARGSGRVFVHVPVAYRDLFPVGCRVVVRPLVLKKAGEKAVGLR